MPVWCAFVSGGNTARCIDLRAIATHQSSKAQTTVQVSDETDRAESRDACGNP